MIYYFCVDFGTPSKCSLFFINLVVARIKKNKSVYDSAWQVLQLSISFWIAGIWQSILVTDAQLIEFLGLEDYQGIDLPDWMVTKLGVLVAKGDVTVGQFMLALQYMLTHA